MTNARQKLANAARKVILDSIVRRPTTESPAEGRLALVDNGTLDQWGSHRAVAKFKDGKWIPERGGELPFEPTVWLDFRK